MTLGQTSSGSRVEHTTEASSTHPQTPGVAISRLDKSGPRVPIPYTPANSKCRLSLADSKPCCTILSTARILSNHVDLPYLALCHAGLGVCPHLISMCRLDLRVKRHPCHHIRVCKLLNNDIWTLLIQRALQKTPFRRVEVIN